MPTARNQDVQPIGRAAAKPHAARVAFPGDQVGLAHELRDDVETLARRAADRRARQYVHHSPARRGCSGAVGAGNGRRTILFRRGLPAELGRTPGSRWSAYRRDRRWLCPRAAQERTVREGKQELSGRCFAWVQTYDEKPKRRLFELLKSQGMQPNQQVDFLSDGGEDVRNVQLYLNPQAEHLLDWFHLTMRLTVLNQTAKGLPESVGEGEDQYELRTCVIKDLERIKWYLWHGNVFQALNELQSLEMDLDAAAFESKNENSQKLLKGVEELHTYVERNQEFVPNYGERYRNGERIASGFVESAINQVVSKRMVKKQQMGWSQRGAHLLLQIRTRVLDEEWENTFRRWYPDFRPQGQAKKAA